MVPAYPECPAPAGNLGSIFARDIVSLVPEAFRVLGRPRVLG